MPAEDKIKPELQKEIGEQEGRTEKESGRAETIPENRQSIIDSQCCHPKVSPFSGDDPKPKTEASYEEWQYEVECIRKGEKYSNETIVQAGY